MMQTLSGSLVGGMCYEVPPPRPRERGEPGFGWERAQKAVLLSSSPATAPVVSAS